MIFNYSRHAQGAITNKQTIYFINCWDVLANSASKQYLSSYLYREERQLLHGQGLDGLHRGLRARAAAHHLDEPDDEKVLPEHLRLDRKRNFPDPGKTGQNRRRKDSGTERLRCTGAKTGESNSGIFRKLVTRMYRP